jgi:hydrogenase nickel incorporation protein HypA/HybF
MHELSIALGIVEAVAEELDHYGGGRVRAVHLRLGALSGVAKEALQSAYPLACEGSPLEGSSLVVLDVAESRDLEVTAMELDE